MPLVYKRCIWVTVVTREIVWQRCSDGISRKSYNFVSNPNKDGSPPVAWIRRVLKNRFVTWETGLKCYIVQLTEYFFIQMVRGVFEVLKNPSDGRKFVKHCRVCGYRCDSEAQSGARSHQGTQQHLRFMSCEDEGIIDWRFPLVLEAGLWILIFMIMKFVKYGRERSYIYVKEDHSVNKKTKQQGYCVGSWSFSN